MASFQYTAKDGDFIDWVVWKYYGFVDTALEAVMDHEDNRGLRNVDEELTAGTVIVLPEIPAGEERVVRLWD